MAEVLGVHEVELEAEDSAEILAFVEAHPTVGEAWDRLDSCMASMGVGTDYVEVAG